MYQTLQTSRTMLEVGRNLAGSQQQPDGQGRYAEYFVCPNLTNNLVSMNNNKIAGRIQQIQMAIPEISQ